MIGYSVTESPVGYIVVVTRAGRLRNIYWGPNALDDLHADVGDDFEPAADAEKICLQLDEYFAGTRCDFDVAVDLTGVSRFRRRALEALRLVPYGETITYGELAAEAGNPAAARAAGTACAHNPIPIVIPCHRVVAANGLGGYGGGLDTKRFLLGLESANVS